MSEYEYSIMGEYRGNQEEIDTSESLVEAEFLAEEYKMSFGQEWAIWIS